MRGELFLSLSGEEVVLCKWCSPSFIRFRGNLLEYSVVYTDRAINLLSKPFQKVMNDISAVSSTVGSENVALFAVCHVGL